MNATEVRGGFGLPPRIVAAAEVYRPRGRPQPVGPDLQRVLHATDAAVPAARQDGVGVVYYNVQLQGQQFQVIGHDGNPVDRTFATDSLLLAAGGRFDVLVRGGPPGRTQLQTLAYNTGPGGNQFPQATLAATLVSEGAPVRPVDMPTTVGAFEDLGNATPAAQRTIVFSETDNPTRTSSTAGCSHEGHGWQDVASIPANGQIVIRTHFLNYTGKTVLHCHILNHEDLGMMAVLEIIQ
jgi:suppressor of ftsI